MSFAEDDEYYHYLPALLLYKGMSLSKLRRYTEALRIFNLSLEKSKKANSLVEECRANTEMGIVYKNLGDYVQSLNAYFQALTIAEELSDFVLQGKIFSNIGNLYRRMDDLEKADEYLKLALENAEKDPSSPKHLIIGRLINLGGTVYAKGNLAESKELNLRALKLSDESSPKVYEAYAISNLGLILHGENEYEKALNNLKKGLQLFRSQKRLPDIVQALIYMARVYKDLKLYPQALDCLDQSVEISERVNQGDGLRNAYKEYYEIFELQGDYQSALDYYKLYDISKEALMNQDKLRQVAELEKERAIAELAARNVVIEEQNEKLENVNKELEQFSYAASHDLREPLRTIKSFTALLKHKEGHNFSDEAQEFMDFVNDAAKRMDNLLVDLLDYSRVGRSQIPHQQVDLNIVVGEALQNLGSQIQEREAMIDLPRMPIVKGVHTLLVQLFQNLISNGIKFTKERPVIKIRSQRKGEHFEFSISDNGIGIENKYLEQIFHIFKRLHAVDRFQGSGIGLSTCKKIVEIHQGKIWVESLVDVGTTFHFSLKA